MNPLMPAPLQVVWIVVFLVPPVALACLVALWASVRWRQRRARAQAQAQAQAPQP